MPPKKRGSARNQPEVWSKCRTKIDFKSLLLSQPEDDIVFSSSFKDSAVVVKPKDLKHKLMIASNITQQCKTLKNKLGEGKSPQERVNLTIETIQEYTNLPKKELKSIYDDITTRDRSFKKCLKDIKTISESILELLADDIRTIFFKYICEDNHFPPKKLDLLRDLKNLSVLHETVHIQRLVRNKLLKYELFPQFNRYLLSEHPERVYQRTLYLNQVKSFRSQEKIFVYVEVRRIASRSHVSSGFIAGLAASPATGQLEKFFTKDSSELNAKKWLQQRILEIVPENSVVVLAQPKVRKELSAASSKSDLMAWLYLNEIPYEDNPHTAALYELYVKYKSKHKQQGLYDHVFLNAGYTVINFPTEWRSLNYFMRIWSDVSMIRGYQPVKPEILKQKILNATEMITDLKEAEESLIEREIKMMREDIAMEKVVENIKEMVKDGQIKLSDFPKECCGDKTDYYEINISNYVIE